ncbi:MAG: guanylate kinase [Desulfovibrio sp.]|jgi:guanylate kinase|nr:guanylate kinase [Desulfovibrio sp.]
MVICAPSGTGKTTLSRRLLLEFPNLVLSVSCTTRPPRQGEIDGRDYEFLSREDFLTRRDGGFFAEWAQVHGNYYGTPLVAAWKLLAAGRDVLFDIDVQGASQIRRSLPAARLVFLLPPSRAELERRLRGRDTESEESLAVRMKAAALESAQAHWFEFWIVNEDLEKAWEELRAVYMASTLSPALRPNFLACLLSGWDQCCNPQPVPSAD